MSISSTLHVHTSQGDHAIAVPPARLGWLLTDLLRHASLPLNTRCGQHGLCQGCVVELLSGSLVHAASAEQVTAAGQPLLLRGCQHRLDGQRPGQVTVRIPPRSLLAYQPQIVTDYRINVPRAHDPLLQVLAFDLRLLNSRDSGETLVAHVAQTLDETLSVRLGPGVAEKLKSMAPSTGPQKSRSNDEQNPSFVSGSSADPTRPLAYVTVRCEEACWTISDVSIQPPRPLIGAAVDIGTTTVAVMLTDLATGNVLSRAAAFNQQMHLGDDVVTRITLCANNPAMVGQLQQSVADRTIAPLLTEAATRAGVSPEQIACLSVAGNTTMQHLVAGVNPASMGVAPFTAVFLNHRVLEPGQVFGSVGRSACAPGAAIHLLPSAAAYVGADLCAGIVASGLEYDDGPSLLVDVGTNGEVILKHRDRLLGCATAAGPAFEGAGLACGIRAGEGAISHIRIQPRPFEVHTHWIGQEKTGPTGLCGSAYIDFLAEARRAGVLGPTGRFDSSALPEAATRIIPWTGHDLAFHLETAAGEQPIVVCQRDIAQLLQAKAAIAAGILILLNQAGLTPQDVKTVYLAGGFGTHMNPRNAIDCGLLPGFTPGQIQVVGNSSLAGAYLALVDSGILDEVARISKRLEVVELNLDPSFETTYIDQLSLPDPIQWEGSHAL